MSRELRVWDKAIVVVPGAEVADATATAEGAVLGAYAIPSAAAGEAVESRDGCQGPQVL